VAAFGVETIQNGGRCHGNQGAIFFNSLNYVWGLDNSEKET
jgi:hypothetical protein